MNLISELNIHMLLLLLDSRLMKVHSLIDHFPEAAVYFKIIEIINLRQQIISVAPQE